MAAFCGGGGAGLAVRVPVALGAGTGAAVPGRSASGGGAGAGVGSWARALAVAARWLLCVVFLGLGVCVCIWVCWFGIRRNKAGGAGVAYGTWIRRTGRRVAVRGWRRRVLAGRAAPASPFAEGRGFCGPPLPHVSLLAPRPPSQFPCHGDCLRRDSPTLSSTTLGSFITRAMVARNIKP